MAASCSGDAAAGRGGHAEAEAHILEENLMQSVTGMAQHQQRYCPGAAKSEYTPPSKPEFMAGI